MKRLVLVLVSWVLVTGCYAQLAAPNANFNASQKIFNIRDVGAPIFIRLGKRRRVYDDQLKASADEEGAERVGTLKNIRISDIKATVKVIRHQRGVHTIGVEVAPEETTDREWAKAGPIMIAGIPDHHIENVILENIDISYPGGLPPGKINLEVPEDEERYPEQFFFGILPAWGAYIRHAKNIEFKNVKHDYTLRRQTRNDCLG